MKKLILPLWGSMVLTGMLQAGEQVVAVTPQTLAGWAVTGAGKASLDQASVLTLPAGAQLSRRFDADSVTVQFKAQPVFGATPEDYLILEAGPAALAFVRDGSNGQLVLAIGDSTVLPLPYAVKLNSDGSSVDPVELQLTYDRATGGVVVTGFGQTLQYSGTPGAKPMRVVLTSGADAALTLQTLEVLLVTPEVASGDGRGGASSQSASANGTAADSTFGRTASVDQRVAEALRPAAGGDSPGTSPSANGGRQALEIFTPPSVRLRVAMALSAVKAAQQK